MKKNFVYIFLSFNSILKSENNRQNFAKIKYFKFQTPCWVVLPLIQANKWIDGQKDEPDDDQTFKAFR